MTDFVQKRLVRVCTEMCLNVLPYALGRVMRILGMGEMMCAMSA